VEVLPAVTGEASTEAAACVKVYQITSYLNKCFAFLAKNQEGIALRSSRYSR
jgi:hypothetical protein